MSPEEKLIKIREYIASVYKEMIDKYDNYYYGKKDLSASLLKFIDEELK